jgi:replicative DNA helicase
MSAPTMNGGRPQTQRFDEAMARASMADEQALLGAMMVANPASGVAGEVRDRLRPAGDAPGMGEHHFVAWAHQEIWKTIITLMDRGEAYDMLAVAAEMPADLLLRVNGVPYLHTCMEACPTVANATTYAINIRNATLLRELGEKTLRWASQVNSAALNEAVEVYDRVSAELALLEVPTRSGGPVAWEVAGAEALEEMERLAAVAKDPSLGMTEFSFGWPDLDRIVRPAPGSLVIVAGRPGMAKALALDTPLPTPVGWTTMGEVKAGDTLIDAQGMPTKVTWATEVMRDRPCYEVEFSDGSTIVADAQHQWTVSTRNARRSQRVRTEVLNTEQMSAAVRIGAEQRLNYAIQVAQPIVLPTAVLPIEPYTFGAWLGDGHSEAARITSDDPELLTYIEDDGYEVRSNPSHPMLYGFSLPQQEWDERPSRTCLNCNKLMAWHRPSGWCQSCRHARPSVPSILRSLGVWGNKYIPQQYLRASEAQRRALLAGLLDTDGTVLPHGSVKFVVTSRQLAYGVRELVLSLGYRCTIATQPVKGRTAASSVAYSVNFSTADEVFRLERKKLAHKERSRTKDRKRNGVRYVTGIRPVASVPVRCVEVDNAEHLYLAGETMIPTHNSTAMRNIAQHLSMRKNLPTLVFSLEMSRLEISVAMLCAGARLKSDDVKHGTLSDEDWVQAARYLSQYENAPLEIDETVGINLAYVDRQLASYVRRYGRAPVAFFVDYVQLGEERGHGNRQEAVAAMSRGYKLLAKKYGTVAVILSQLSRGPEQRAEKIPQLSDLRESGGLEQDADVVILLYREDYYDKESPRAGEIDFIIAKHRNGPTDTISLAALLHQSRIASMAID